MSMMNVLIRTGMGALRRGVFAYEYHSFADFAEFARSIHCQNNSHSSSCQARGRVLGGLPPLPPYISHHDPQPVRMDQYRGAIEGLLADGIERWRPSGGTTSEGPVRNSPS